MTRILVIEHDPADPLLRLGEWLTETGVELIVCRPYAGDEIPSTLDGFDAVISMGGEMGARDDDRAPWLPATRALLASAIASETPTLGICLGAQLLAAAAGASVQKGANGAEIGAYLAAKRDAAMSDPLCADLPMTPDVMHYHYDVVPTLPPGAVLLVSSMGYPNQAWRQGTAAWALQFHIEPTAEDVRNWARKENVPLTGRLGPALDEAEDEMGEVWRDFAHRFVHFIREGRTPPRTLLPVVAIQT
jgi:GMP synthase-like glutamine amidotransferase